MVNAQTHYFGAAHALLVAQGILDLDVLRRTLRRARYGDRFFGHGQTRSVQNAYTTMGVCDSIPLEFLSSALPSPEMSG